MSRRRLWHIYTITFGIAVTVGGLTELIQLLGTRNADLGDFLRNVLGASAALLLALGLDRGVWGETAGRTLLRPLIFGLALALLAVAFLPLAGTSIAYIQRDRAFPVVCEFELGWESRFVYAKDARLRILEPRQTWAAEGTGRAGEITFFPADYPALVLREPHPNWTGFQNLCFTAYSDLADGVDLIIRIHDAQHTQEYSDRFNRRLRVDPGENRLSIPLADVRHAPRNREMNMTAIRGVVVFAYQPADTFSLVFDSFRLE